MDDYSKSVRFRLLRWMRCAIDCMTSSVLGYLYGNRISVPPVEDRILLHPATQLAEHIKAKRHKSEEVVAAYIKRIMEVQPLINAVVEDRFDEALEEARKVDEMIESGEMTEDDLASRPFLGVPFTTKEHISVKGMKSTNGLIALKDNVSDDDADVVKLMRQAGAIPIATTNIPELCLWWESLNNVYGNTANPYDTRRSCGGSSGGEGALLGAAGSVIGIGSDIGGSIRLPSVMNGIFGHKPSSGTVSSVGLNCSLSEKALEYASIGPMCRYSVDLLTMMKTFTRNDPRLKLDETVDFSNLKIFFADDLGNCPLASPIEPAVQESMETALKHFREKFGIEPTKVSIKGLDEAFNLWKEVLTDANPQPFAEIMSIGRDKVCIPLEIVKWCFGRSDFTIYTLFNAFLTTYVSRSNPVDRKAAVERFELLKAHFDDILDTDDCVFLFPTQPEPAPFRHASLTKTSNLGFTCIFNVLKYPVTHIPMTQSNDGLPVGIQCVAKAFNDRLTIAVAEELGRTHAKWVAPS